MMIQVGLDLGTHSEEGVGWGIWNTRATPVGLTCLTAAMDGTMVHAPL